jgi:hypothetical protein
MDTLYQLMTLFNSINITAVTEQKVIFNKDAFAVFLVTYKLFYFCAITNILCNDHVLGLQSETIIMKTKKSNVPLLCSHICKFVGSVISGFYTV